MIFFTFLEAIMYFFSICISLHTVKNYKLRTNKLLLIIPLSYVLLYILSLFASENITTIILALIGTSIIISAKITLVKTSFVSILKVYFMLYSTNVLFTSVVILFSNKPYDTFFKVILSFILNVIINFLCIAVCITKHSKINTLTELIPRKVKNLTLLSLIISAITVTLFSEYPNYQNIERWNIVTKIIILFLIILIGTAFPIMIANSVSKSVYQKQLKDYESQIQAQAEHYIALANSNYELRRFKHDYNNLRIGLSELIRSNNNHEALKMLNYYENAIKSSESLILFDTGNGIVDALLAEKQKQADLFATKIIFSGYIPADSISAIDLCIIFGNTLDNAIEACEKIKTSNIKNIYINCNCMGGFMFLTIKNPVSETVKIKNNIIETTKTNKSSHGFGLYSLKKALRKYDGNINLRCKDKEFVIDIDLMLTKCSSA